MVEQPFQRVLRMSGADGFPRLIVGFCVEAGKDDGALRQARDGGQQLARGGDASGRARGDHRMCRRFRLPAFRKPLQQRIAACGGVHQALLRQNLRPVVGDEGEEAQHLLPVRRVFLRREMGQSFRVAPGDLDFVEQTGKRAGEPRGLINGACTRERGPAWGLAEPLDEAREHEPSLKRRDGIRQRLVLFVAEARLVLVDVAERADARQQQRLPRRSAHEGEAERAASASRRQQDREPAQCQRIDRIERHDPAGEQALRQGIDERGMGRHRVKGGRARAHPPSLHRSPPR